jgi:two-component system, cell cycle sensor histidine kinase and response regulator CckA
LTIERAAASAAIGPIETSAAAAVFDASPNAIVAVDADARLRYVNPQALRTFGYTLDELIGEKIEVLLPERLADRHVTHRSAFIAHPVARPMGIGLDLAGRRRNGTEFPVEISLSPVMTASGLQVFATIVDIGARKSMESELLQAQKLESIGRLAGGIAHDFNNMLFAIRGYVELLEEDLGADRRAAFDPDEALKSVAAIGQAADRASDLTHQLLTFSRQQVVSPKVVDLNASVLAVEPMLRRLIGENVTLHLKLDPEIGRMRADPGQIDQILVNLVVNARDAIEGAGTVSIETSNFTFDEPFAMEHFEVEPGRYVLLAVSDTGVGMSREVREHIFEPFFTTKEVGRGTGLGLATIYGIVRQAGGHIWLYSEPRHGSTFKLYFPRVDEMAEPDPTAEPAETLPASGTILIVEDELHVREMLEKVVTRAGFRVITVADGPAALEVEARHPGEIDILISDVVMPAMSGIDLAEQMAARRPGIGTILLSGYTAETLDLEQATRRGARFISKPVASGDLRRAIAEVIAGKRPAD